MTWFIKAHELWLAGATGYVSEFVARGAKTMRVARTMPAQGAAAVSK